MPVDWVEDLKLLRTPRVLQVMVGAQRALQPLLKWSILVASTWQLLPLATGSDLRSGRLHQLWLLGRFAPAQCCCWDQEALLFVDGVLTQNFNIVDHVKFLEKKFKK
jgi:hypothetical protein